VNGSTSRDAARPLTTRDQEKTMTVNSPSTDPENSYSGEDDTSPRDRIQPVCAHSDQPLIERPLPNKPASSEARAVDDEIARSNRQPIKKTRPARKQSRKDLARSDADIPGADYLSRNRAERPDLMRTPQIAVSTWPIMERIGILGLMVVWVASASVLLVSYWESLPDSAPPSSSLAWRAGPLPSVQAREVGSIMIDDRTGTAGGLVQVSSPGESPTESQQTATGPMPPIPPARETLPTATAAPIAVPSPTAPAPSEPPDGLANDGISRLMKRGQDFLNEGDFAAARLLFERAANAGSAEAALALGSTYDPSVIKQLGAVSVSPGPNRALKWYATAADRGSSDAVDRYADLMRAR
jgi:hypothetical protein